MAIDKNHRFEIPFETAFPLGLVLVGEIGPKNEFQENRNRPAKQVVDEVTGKRVWVATVTDPDETKAKRASFPVEFLADHQPVPASGEVLPGMRPIELEGLTVQPKVAGNGEYKYQSFLFRATGIRQATSGAGPASPPAAPKSAPRSGGSGDGQGKAA